MAIAKKTSVATSAALANEAQVLARVGLTARQLRSITPKALTATQRAKALGVLAGQLQAVTPIVLSAAKPLKGTSSLTIYSSLMVYPLWPTGVGQALYSSDYPGATSPGAQVAFNRVKKGKNHLVEFYVSLNMDVAYEFRVFSYPLGDFVDVTIQGPKSSTVISAIVPPLDELPSPAELGAAIQQRNGTNDGAGWSLQSVEVNVVG